MGLQQQYKYNNILVAEVRHVRRDRVYDKDYQYGLPRVTAFLFWYECVA